MKLATFMGHDWKNKLSKTPIKIYKLLIVESANLTNLNLVNRYTQFCTRIRWLPSWPWPHRMAATRRLETMWTLLFETQSQIRLGKVNRKLCLKNGRAWRVRPPLRTNARVVEVGYKTGMVRSNHDMSTYILKMG